MIVIGGLFIAGIVAGILGTVTGMASLVSYPILLATGLSPIVANVTNTAALIFSGLGATVSSRQELKYNKRDLIWILPTAAVGSIIGCILLLAFPSGIFEKIAPFMIGIVAIFFIVQPHLKARAVVGSLDNNPSVKKSFWSLLAILVIGAYGGYFGAASGIFMLLVFSATQGIRLTTANALKNVTMGLTNLIATGIFIFFGHIDWRAAIFMGAGFIIGGYVGPIIARRLPEKILRWIIIIGALLLAADMFYSAYLK